MPVSVSIPLHETPPGVAADAPAVSTPFADRFAAFVGAKRGVTYPGSAEAFEAAFCAVPLALGARVLVSSCSPPALWEAIDNLKLEAVVREPDPQTLVLDGASIEADLWPKIDAVVVSHLYGRPAPLEGLVASARKFGVFVLEDAVHAHGAEYRGKKVGSFGDAAVFGFEPGRILADDDGGAVVVTSRAALLDGLKSTAQKFSKPAERRLHARLTALNDGLVYREKMAALYREALGGVPGIRSVLPERQGRHVFYRFVVRTPEAEKLGEALAAASIETCRPDFPAARRAELPVAKAAELDTLCLPMGTHLTEAMVKSVCDAVKTALK